MTHAEPGRALTGTIPANQQGDQPERIAMLWLKWKSPIISVATATATAAVTTVVVMRNMRWCLRQKIKRLLETNLKTVDDSGIDYTLPLAGEVSGEQCSGALFPHADFCHP